MSAAGESRSTVCAFFRRSRRWAQHVLRNYSAESFCLISVKNRGRERKTTRKEDQLIVQKGREKARAPVRAELNSPIKKKISRPAEVGARTQKADFILDRIDFCYIL